MQCELKRQLKLALIESYRNRFGELKHVLKILPVAIARQADLDKENIITGCSLSGDQTIYQIEQLYLSGEVCFSCGFLSFLTSCFIGIAAFIHFWLMVFKDFILTAHEFGASPAF